MCTSIKVSDLSFNTDFGGVVSKTIQYIVNFCMYQIMDPILPQKDNIIFLIAVDQGYIKITSRNDMEINVLITHLIC